MKIRIEVTQADLDEMLCESLKDFEEEIRNQLDNGIVTDDGGAGENWMAAYQLEIVQVQSHKPTINVSS